MAVKLSVGALSGEGVTCSCGRIRTNGLLSGVTAEAINGRSINTIKPWMVQLNGYTIVGEYQNSHALLLLMHFVGIPSRPLSTSFFNYAWRCMRYYRRQLLWHVALTPPLEV